MTVHHYNHDYFLHQIGLSLVLLRQRENALYLMLTNIPGSHTRLIQYMILGSHIRVIKYMIFIHIYVYTYMKYFIVSQSFLCVHGGNFRILLYRLGSKLRMIKAFAQSHVNNVTRIQLQVFRLQIQVSSILRSLQNNILTLWHTFIQGT